MKELGHIHLMYFTYDIKFELEMICGITFCQIQMYFRYQEKVRKKLKLPHMYSCWKIRKVAYVIISLFVCWTKSLNI